MAIFGLPLEQHPVVNGRDRAYVVHSIAAEPYPRTDLIIITGLVTDRFGIGTQPAFVMP